MMGGGKCLGLVGDGGDGGGWDDGGMVDIWDDLTI